MTHNLKDRIRRAWSPIRGNARALLAATLVVAFAAACDVHGISDPGTLVSIAVSPNATLIVGGTQQMVATGYDAAGRVVAINPTWSIAAGGGTVAAGGLFTAGTVSGVYANTVVATVGSIKGQASMTVTAGALATITIVPNPVTLAVTTTQQFIAVGKDASGNIVNITPTWSVVASGGSIDQGGIFKAGNTAGTYANTVQASNNTIRGFATVIVTTGPLASISITPNPDTLVSGATRQFIATGKDAGGNTVLMVPTWSVVAAGGTIDGGGIFTAGLALGTYANTVKATSGTLSGTATVVVKAGPLATIVVTPNPATMVVNGTQQMTAVGTDAAGHELVIVPTWDVVTASNGASITATGLYSAGTLTGTFVNKVRATSGAIAGFATIVVTAGPLASITVTPTPVTLPYNTIQQFTAVGRDANNNIFVITPVWSVVNGGGVISASGQFTSGATAGTFLATVRATSGAIFGSADVIVTAPAPPPPPIGLLGAAVMPNGIMAGLSVTCSGLGIINADISISPGSTLSGFGPCVYTGVTHLGDPTALTAQNQLTAAYNTLMGMPCPAANNFGTVDYAGKVLPAGVYCSPSTIGVTGSLTLNGGGDPNAVFVFQAGSAITGSANIVLTGSAQAKNVYWVAGSSATLNASAWKGNVIALSSVNLLVNTNLVGRALARNGSVTLDATSNVITLP